MAAKINQNNLTEKSLNNFEVIRLLQKLSLEVDPCGFSRVLDVVENLTGDRNFFDNREYESYVSAEIFQKSEK